MSSTTTPSASVPGLQESAIRHLQALLRCDTQSPPGNEVIAAEYIREALAEAGIDSTFMESDPGRVSVVARLNAENPTGRPILFMGHIDVVTVEPDKWERDPFSGDLVDGFIWGRGAVDMKGQVAAELAAFIAIKESGIPLTRDLVFVAFADEEAGGTYGADFVWKNHQDMIDAEFAINEGGGNPMMIGDKLFYACQVAEKGASRLKMTVRGEPGHAAIPKSNTAMEKLGSALQRLHEWQSPTIITATVRQMLEAIGEALGGETARKITAVLDAGELSWDDVRSLPLPENEQTALYATTHNTIRPTIIQGGHRINVIPSEITVDIDVRILPGVDPEDFRREIQEVVGDLAEIDFLNERRDSGLEADPGSDFFEAIKETMAEVSPEATVIPVMSWGGTDAGHVPGIKVYGFFPLLPTERAALYETLMHSHNERIHVDDLAFATRFLYDIAVRVCG
jgi:acetylornithine deacetylase/succinyl-diaminopimelate desuccinylase-like protein